MLQFRASTGCLLVTITLLGSFAHKGPSGNAIPPLQFDQLTLFRILLGCHPLCDISTMRRDKSSAPYCPPTTTAPLLQPQHFACILFMALLPFLTFELLEAWEPSCFITETYSWCPQRLFKSMKVDATVCAQALALSFISCVT